VTSFPAPPDAVLPELAATDAAAAWALFCRMGARDCADPAAVAALLADAEAWAAQFEKETR